LFKLALSLDVEEWFHSGRWVDPRQATEIPDTSGLLTRIYGQPHPAGEVIEPMHLLLDLFERHGVHVTFFVLGEVARWYPGLVRDMARRGHEIACHGWRHVDMTVLGPADFRADLREATALLTELAGVRPIGYRAPNLVYASWATRILEEEGYEYDASVCAARPLGGKYRGWADAPRHPYRPAYDDIARRGHARLIELPLPAFPVLRIAAGSGITTRVFGRAWSMIALRHALARGDTSYYFHPWEVGRRPRRPGSPWRAAIFQRHVGPWMLRTVTHLLETFGERICTARTIAERARLREPRVLVEGRMPVEDHRQPSDLSAGLAPHDDTAAVAADGVVVDEHAR
jgi:hypothetical protein